MYLGYNWLIIQKTLPINAFFVNSKQWLQVMFTYQSFFLVLTIYSFDFFSGDLLISPVVSDIRYHNTKLFDVWLHWVINQYIMLFLMLVEARRGGCRLLLLCFTSHHC